MAWTSWVSKTETIRTSVAKIKFTWSYRQNYAENKSQVKTGTIVVDNVTAKIKVVACAGTTGDDYRGFTKKTTTVNSGSTSTVYNTEHTSKEFGHSSDGVFRGDRGMHLYIVISYNGGAEVYNKGWQVLSLVGRLPKIDRTCAKGTISATSTYETVTVTYTSGEYGDFYIKDISDTNPTYKKVATVTSGSKKYIKEYSGLTPGKTYNIGAYTIRNTNEVKSATVSVSKATLSVPAVTIPEIIITNLDYFGFNVTLGSGGKLFDRISDYGGKHGKLTVKVIGDCTADGDEYETTINQIRNGVGYQFSKETHGIKPSRTYTVVVSVTQPVTNTVVTKQKKVTTPGVTSPEISNLTSKIDSPRSMTISANTSEGVWYDSGTKLEGKAGYLGYRVEYVDDETDDILPLIEERETSINQITNGIKLKSLNPNTTYIITVICESPIISERVEYSIMAITSSLTNVAYIKTEDGWRQGYLYYKADAGWKEATPFITIGSEWVRGIL